MIDKEYHFCLNNNLERVFFAIGIRSLPALYIYNQGFNKWHLGLAWIEAPLIHATKRSFFKTYVPLCLSGRSNCFIELIQKQITFSISPFFLTVLLWGGRRGWGQAKNIYLSWDAGCLLLLNYLFHWSVLSALNKIMLLVVRLLFFTEISEPSVFL